ncbi:MAG: hypothetical protein ACD_61C00269G0003 [uncultured bacterium]|nr:MAG: hypothetical protein ACD_61C00269G0003 [uncultured bacterium]
MDQFEHFNKTAENFYLQLDFIHSLQDQTRHIHNLRVLDYGSGSQVIGRFGMIQKDQEVVLAYDPMSDITPSVSKNIPGAEVRRTNQAPTGEKFHLIVCNFSLHHVNGDLDSVIKELTVYSPEIIGITDYDFTEASLEDFRKTFISEQEIKELNTLFNGDWQACFDYHRRLGLNDFRRCLQESGFNLVVSKAGDKIAKNKFFLVGKKI